MFDDGQRLRENPLLFELLSHYAKLGSADRHIWQDRLMQMGDAVEPKELSRFHGELIAFEWIEQIRRITTPPRRRSIEYGRQIFRLPMRCTLEEESMSLRRPASC